MGTDQALTASSSDSPTFTQQRLDPGRGLGGQPCLRRRGHVRERPAQGIRETVACAKGWPTEAPVHARGTDARAEAWKETSEHLEIEIPINFH